MFVPALHLQGVAETLEESGADQEYCERVPGCFVRSITELAVFVRHSRAISLFHIPNRHFGDIGKTQSWRGIPA